MLLQDETSQTHNIYAKLIGRAKKTGFQSAPTLGLYKILSIKSKAWSDQNSLHAYTSKNKPSSLPVKHLTGLEQYYHTLPSHLGF